MSIVIKISDDKKITTIAVNGRFDFSLHGEFRKAYKDKCVSGGQIVVDLNNTDYLDSSALGMLLLLKEYADGIAAKIKIINVKNEIREILNIASFDKLFIMEG
jgi:anti-anti-sigma factor